MKTKCVIVDDEPLAIEALEILIKKLPDLEIVDKCTDAIRAFGILQKKHIDLMFLDIQMPEITGLSFLKTLKNPPFVIFTTAYREYALEAFDLDVVDYLLKPISFERLMKAINKYYQVSGRTIQPSSSEKQKAFITVRADRKNVKINLEDILYIESLKDYVRIHTPGKRTITKSTLSSLEDQLPSEQFLRIHRSYIVSIKRIRAFTHEFVEVEDKALPIGKNYRELVLTCLNKG
jgi:DNA-binding LytR/AlgR family response regulator